MRTLLKPTRSELMQLDDIARNLGIGKQWSGPKMVADVVDASLRRADPLLKEVAPRGELVAEKFASHYHVRFEEVRTEKDIDILKEPGTFDAKRDWFCATAGDCGTQKLMLYSSDVFTRRRTTRSGGHHPQPLGDPGSGLLEQVPRTITRIAEPQQRLLPFKRERVDNKAPSKHSSTRLPGNSASTSDCSALW